MKMKSAMLFAVAIGCGLVAMMGVQQVLKGKNETAAEPAKTKVLVTVQAITPGAPLTKDNVAFKEWPADAVPPGAVTKPEEFEDRALKFRAVPGEIVMIEKLAGKGEFSASSDIPKGMRVVSVPVDRTMTHSGLILPGDRVDILCTYRDRTNQNMRKSETVLEFIEVFATDNLRDISTTGSAEANAENISLLVTPDQANELHLAESRGQLHLTLRSKSDSELLAKKDEETPEDIELVEPAPVVEANETDETIQEFLADDKDEEPVTTEVIAEAPTKKVWRLHIFRGTDADITEFELPSDSTEGVETLNETEITEPAPVGDIDETDPTKNPLLGYVKKLLSGP